MVDLNDLDMSVDISVSGPEDYADNSPNPLPIGSYKLRLLAWDWEKAKTAGKPAVLLIKQVEVADGQYEGRKVGFQRVYATTFTRKDKSGRDTKASQLADFLSAFDLESGVEAVNGGLPAITQFLNAQVDGRSIFKAKVDWEAFDTDYYNEQAAMLGIQKGDYRSPAAKELNKKATLKGAVGFPDGKPEATNPNSGNRLEARVRLSNFYAAKG